MNLWSTVNDKFPEPPKKPQFSREICLSPKGIRAFLKLSRHATDDVLKQRLNSVLNDHDLNNVPRETLCFEFTSQILYPGWNSRLEAIEYCSGQAQIMRTEIETNFIGSDKHEFDLRLDPYAERSHIQSREKRFEHVVQFENWLQNEKNIEKIVKDRSIDILNDSCYYNNWLQGFFQSYRK